MEDEYYKSHQKLAFIGVEGQRKLQQAKVLIIGAGGLGCPCLQYLAGCGIDVIGIADFDKVDLSNIHRQFLYHINDIGKTKVSVAVEKLSAYNPHVLFHAYHLFIEESNVLELIKGYDVVVDCTDNFLVRYLINDACVYLDKPLVYGAIHQTEGHVTVFNYRQSATLRCLFPELNTNEVIQSCADIGAYNIVCGMIGLMMANEVIKIILDHPDVLKEKLCYYDALTNSTKQIKFHPSQESRQKSIDRFKDKKEPDVISPEKLQQKIARHENIILIDVRESNEHQEFNIGGENIPLQRFLQSSFAHISPQTEIIVYCQSGDRSHQAVNYLKQQHLLKSASLKGGINLLKSI